VGLEKFATIRLVGSRDDLEPFVASLACGTPVEIVPIRGGRYSAVAQLEWARLTVRRRIADVVFFPHWDAPMLPMPSHSVVTIHDLIVQRLAGATSPAKRFLARAMLARAVKGAARLIAVSEFTRSDFVLWFPEAADRVSVVPEGVAEVFSRPAPPESALPKGIRPPYLLCVANRKPHKNLEAAVEVLARLQREHPALRLAIAGERFPAWVRTLQRAYALGLGERIVDLDQVNDLALHALYAHASVYLHPSRYEGFGLPILEAMASGAPVVASNATAIPEVAGPGALLFAPDDISGMTAVVARLLHDREFRERTIEAGRRQVERFSWARTAEATGRILLAAAQA
jgi:glycosyltransferase involved in cell wall biosynthesis